MARILWPACFEAGSYLPVTPLVRELIARGHDVTALCVPPSQATFAALGCRFRSTTSVEAYDPTRPPPPTRSNDPESKRRRYPGIVRPLFDDTLAELRAERYDLAFVDPLEPGGGFAAEAAGVPSVSYAHFAMDEREGAGDVPFSFHFWDPTTPIGPATVTWWNELRGSVGLGPDPRPPEQHRWFRHSGRLTLVLGLPELVHPRGALPAYAHRVGPIVGEAPIEIDPPSWLGSIGGDRPAVLVSGSTSWQKDAQQVVTLGEAARSLGVDVVATVASEHRLPTLPDNVRVTTFVPHSLLMNRVSVIACHAGYGTTTRAACAGIPMLLFPTGRDQFHVARGAVAAGFAISLDQASDVATVRQALDRLLTEVRYRESARSLAHAATQYSGARVAADLIEQGLGEHP